MTNSTFTMMCTQTFILQKAFLQSQTQSLPRNDLYHHLLYRTLYSRAPCSWTANNAASRVGNLFSLLFCVPAAEHSIWRCICRMATGLPPTQSPLWIPPSFPYHSFFILCSEQGWGGEKCAGLHVWQWETGVLHLFRQASYSCLRGNKKKWRDVVKVQ